MKPNDKIYVCGHRGMVGSAIVRQLTHQGFTNLVFKTHAELDLTNQAATHHFFETEKPNYVFLSAAKVGGIHANNTYRAEFLYENLMIAANVIDAAYRNNVSKLLFLGSSCIYPRLASQPISESALLTGPLEPTNEPYAIAKITGIKLIESYNLQYGTQFISAMPTNLYGPNDNYHPQNSHVIPALIRKFVEAKLSGVPEVVVWGSGTPIREFLHADDLAQACVFLMRHYQGNDPINIGCGEGITIKTLAELIKKTVRFEGQLRFDSNFPDGTPKKVLDISKISNLGWAPSVSLEDGLKLAIEDFKKTIPELQSK